MGFAKTILDWYHKNKRSLPWRETSDPYKIWISEIILQQTRVDQGMPYYFRFLQAFPDIKSLALASEQEVLNIWKGLGYYSRARNMHHTALVIMTSFNGVFPSSYLELIILKGIGEYTAAAISSICANEKRPAVDGNVIRVISRYFGIIEKPASKIRKTVMAFSSESISCEDPGNYNQAVMEYGAMICTPISPQCSQCDLSISCYAFQNNMTNSLPIKKNKIIRKIRYFNYFHLTNDDGMLILKKRMEKDIWLNLWDFPLKETDHILNPDEAYAILSSEFQNPNYSKDKLILPQLFKVSAGFEFKGYQEVTHLLTHQILKIRFFSFKANSLEIISKNNFVLIDPSETKYPMPRVIEKFLERNDYFFWH